MAIDAVFTVANTTGRFRFSATAQPVASVQSVREAATGIVAAILTPEGDTVGVLRQPAKDYNRYTSVTDGAGLFTGINSLV